MRRALLTGAIGVALGALACTEPIAPSDATEDAAGVPETAMHFLRWPAADGAPRFVAVSPRTGNGIPRAPSDAIPLQQYSLSFWAVRGRSVTARIDYAGGGVLQPFLQISVPPDALLRRADGSTIADGDSVLISVTIDPTTVRVYFQPSGLTFSSASPLGLNMYYGGADQDLDGDGDVDADDQAIREQRLGAWYQQNVGQPWSPMSGTHDVQAQRFIVGLLHFSGYAISW